MIDQLMVLIIMSGSWSSLAFNFSSSCSLSFSCSAASLSTSSWDGRQCWILTPLWT